MRGVIFRLCGSFNKRLGHILDDAGHFIKFPKNSEAVDPYRAGFQTYPLTRVSFYVVNYHTLKLKYDDSTEKFSWCFGVTLLRIGSFCGCVQGMKGRSSCFLTWILTPVWIYSWLESSKKFRLPPLKCSLFLAFGSLQFRSVCVTVRSIWLLERLNGVLLTNHVLRWFSSLL